MNEGRLAIIKFHIPGTRKTGLVSVTAGPLFTLLPKCRNVVPMVVFNVNCTGNNNNDDGGS